MKDIEENSSITSNSLLFIDTNLENYQSLIPQAHQAEIILLDRTSDGIEQITEVLGNQTNLSSIHILSHGNNAQLDLGSTSLTQDNLAIYQDDLIAWRQALNENADILLHGCNLVADASGLNFVQELSSLTNADIAASNDLTGSSLMGGNWLLETTVGSVEATSIVASNYGSIFATYNGNEYQLWGI